MNCPYCESIVTLESSLKVYSKDYGKLWLCSQYPKCDSYVGCHPGSDKPLGQLANKELRNWKMKAHAAFDPLWQKKYRLRKAGMPGKTGRPGGDHYKKGYARTSGYRWLAKEMNIELNDCHIGMFNVDQCKRVIEICKPYLTTKETTE